MEQDGFDCISAISGANNALLSSNRGSEGNNAAAEKYTL